jgi:hypothetical protein
MSSLQLGSFDTLVMLWLRHSAREHPHKSLAYSFKDQGFSSASFSRCRHQGGAFYGDSDGRQHEDLKYF